jgi:NAD(P)-dependent dehydrogenase (short-subunit alcohol dehydrogenase family)
LAAGGIDKSIIYNQSNKQYMNKLINKVAVITGGNSGIGLSTAKLFKAEGAKVGIIGRDEDAIEDAVAKIGEGAVGISADVSRVWKLKEVFKNLYERLGNIDILIINAGILETGLLKDFTEEQFDKTSDVNFKGAFFTAQQALPYLNNGASVIFTSTTLNEKGYAIAAAYSASEAAVRSLARSFSAEFLDRKIRFNVLSPGPVDTPIFERGKTREEEAIAAKEYFASINPSKRIGNVEEIAEGFLYLASDASGFMVGSELVLDGGMKAL